MRVSNIALGGLPRAQELAPFLMIDGFDNAKRARWKTVPKPSTYIKATAVEAVIGAVYMDARADHFALRRAVTALGILKG